MSTRFDERVRALSPQRLDLLHRRLVALRAAAAAEAPAATAGIWLAEELVLPLRLRGPLDDAALLRALTALVPGAAPATGALQRLDLRRHPPSARYGEALRAAGEIAAAAPLRAVLARLDEDEHLLVLVVRPLAGAPSAATLAADLQARYEGRTPAERAPAEPTPAEPTPAEPTPEELLAGMESYSDEYVDQLLRRLEAEASAGQRPAPRPLAAAPPPAVTASPAVAAVPIEVDPDVAEALLAGLDGLADEDVDALLAQLSEAAHG